MQNLTKKTATQLMLEEFTAKVFKQFGYNPFNVDNSLPVAIKTAMFHARQLGLVEKVGKYEYQFKLGKFNPATFSLLIRKEASRYSNERGRIRRAQAESNKTYLNGSEIHSNKIIFHETIKPTEKDLIKLISDLYGVGCKIEITLPQPNKISFTS